MSGDIEYDLPGLRVALTAEQADDLAAAYTLRATVDLLRAWGGVWGPGELETFAEWFIRERGAA